MSWDTIIPDEFFGPGRWNTPALQLIARVGVWRRGETTPRLLTSLSLNFEREKLL